MWRLPNEKGELSGEHLEQIAARGAKGVERVRKAMDRFADKGGAAWPPTPKAMLSDEGAIERLRTAVRVGRDSVRNLFDAMVFDRDGYSCRYCGRDAFAFFEQSNRLRTLWLVVDHLDATRKATGVYEWDNSVTACWTCNGMKGALPEAAFLQELDSIAQSRLALVARARRAT
jgi:hypothetical protein